LLVARAVAQGAVAVEPVGFAPEQVCLLPLARLTPLQLVLVVMALHKIQHRADQLVLTLYLAPLPQLAAAAARHLHQAPLRVAVMADQVAAELTPPEQLLLVQETLPALLHLKETMEEPEQGGRRLEAQAVAVLEQPAQMVVLQAATAAMVLHLAFLARP
jgi:hypothetical protein